MSQTSDTIQTMYRRYRFLAFMMLVFLVSALMPCREEKDSPWMIPGKSRIHVPKAG